MSWTVSVFSLVVFGSAIVALVVGVAALLNRPDPVAWPLAVMMFAVAAWATAHGISLGYTDIDRITLWHQLRYPGTVTAPVAYLVVVLSYGGYERWLSRRTYALLAAVPAVTVVTVWTNHYHGLFWRSLSTADVGGVVVFSPEFGPWYWINIGYLYLVTAVGLVLVADVIRSGPAYRKQASLMLVGALLPLATNAAVNFWAIGPTVDFTTTALAFSGVVFALALFHFDLLEVRPVAREQLVEDLDDGVVVVGTDGKIRDFNPIAERIFANLEVGKPATEILPSDVAPDGGELVVETSAGERVFRPRATTLTDGRGKELGRIVYLNDVTELIEREQRISVLNRILRHNIRNELTVVSGNLELLEEERDVAGADRRDPVEAARESAERVIEFAEKARHIERMLKRGETATVVSVAGTVTRVVEEARESYPDATVESECPDEGRTAASVVDEQLFEMALAELVENAVEHHHRESPQVTVRVEPDDDRIRVTVADDGPGIPDAENVAVASRVETPLEHGSGLGLWLVKWTASLSSGSVSFGERDPHGSVVTLTLPAASSPRTD